MTMFKRIKLLALLFPIALIGAMKPIDASADSGVIEVLDKTGKQTMWHDAPITLEWHRFTDAKAYFDVYEPLIPTYAEAFADITRDLLLDETFQHIRKEYVAAVEALPQDDREELEGKIKIASAERKERVAYVQQNLSHIIQRNRAYLLAHPESAPKTGSAFIVIARSKWNDILGFATFKMFPDDAAKGSVELDELAIDPVAQGHRLARPLVFSVSTIAHEIKRIYLGTKLWNTKAQEVYKKLGFTIDVPTHPHPCNVTFEYEVKN